MREINAVLCTILLLLGSETQVDSQRTPTGTRPTVGSNNQTQFLQSRDERLFMNFGAPSRFNGTVTSWQYHSYNRYLQDDECEDREFYTSVFLVYRPTGTSKSTYAPVPGSMRSVTITLRCPRDGGFRAREVTLTQAQQFNIQPNDIVAACLPDSSPIRVVGRERSGASRAVYRYTAEQCRSGQFQTVDSSSSSFFLNSEARLHLRAVINADPVTAQLNGGSNPPPFTPFVDSGTYLNRVNPITRTDTITSWNYCYYTAAASDSQQTYTATVGVWRLNPATGQYDLLPGSAYTLELVQPPNTPAKIFCKKEPLQPSNYVGVQSGDIVGVSLPAQNPLPIVASDATGFSLMVHDTQTTPAALQTATLNDVPDMAMHLFPTIENAPTQPPVVQTPSPQTPSPRTPSPQTPSPPTNPGGGPVTPSTGEETAWPITSTPWPEEGETEAEGQQESVGRGTFRGDYIAIGVGAFVVLIIAIVATVIVVYKCRRSSTRTKGPSHFNDGRQDMEISITRQRLLTGSLVSTGSSLVPHAVPVVAPYVPKVENPYDSLASIQQPTSSITNVTVNSPVYYSKLGPNTTDYSLLLEQVIEGRSLEGEEDPYFLPAKEERDLYAQLHQQGITTIKSEDIEVISVLGEGQFGTVSQGIWRNGSGYVLEVAVKTLKVDSEEKDKVKFLQEATIMAQFKHPNVVTLYGVVSTKPMMIVVELLPNGDLQRHLIELRANPEMIDVTNTPKQLLGYCQQIALGMQYLSTKGFVHRDLATRNILLSEEGICKIADFGMSVDLAEGNYYVAKGGRIPLKWTAPEALHYRKYSTASDIWSYACVLYEIWSLGQKPFGASKNRKVIQQIDSGYRLPPPPGCPKAVYKVMIDCWNPTTTKRPAFRTILLSLLDKEDFVLNIPREVSKNSPARELGGPIESGYNMYTQLQNTYRSDYA